VTALGGALTDVSHIRVLAIDHRAEQPALVETLSRVTSPRLSAIRVSQFDQAAAWLLHHAVDAVVVSLSVSDPDALDGIREVSRAARDAVLIVRAQDADPGSAFEVLSAGADDVIPPGSPDAIGWSILGSLARRESVRIARRLAAIVDSSEDAIIGKTLRGEITSWNRGAERIYGYSSAEAIGRPITLLAVDEAQHSEFEEFLARVALGERIDHFDTARRRRDGAIVDVSVTVSPIYDEHGEITGASTVARDITERRRADERLHDAEERFRRAFEDSPIGLAMISLDGRINEANTALATLCARPPEELAGVNWLELVSPADRRGPRRSFRDLLESGGGPMRLETRLGPQRGARPHVSVTANRLEASAGRDPGVLAAFEDITDRKSYEDRLRFMADHDPLTELLNRRRFEEELARHVLQVTRYGSDGALILLDIDQFKQINDSLGHAVGDEVIVTVAGVLRSRLRGSDLVARIGGDEFVVLLPHATRTQAIRTARSLGRAISHDSRMLPGKPLTASMGIVLCEGGPQMSSGSLLLDADAAMYTAKAAGRNGYAVHGGGDPQRERDQRTWMREIERAFERDGFVLLAQPVLDLASQAVAMHELLIRIRDEGGRLIEPTAFLGVAERYGLISRLDQWVALQAVELAERHPSRTFTVNVSGQSLADPALLGTIESRLRDGTPPSGRLIFEITEAAAVTNFATARPFMERLRSLGCGMAMDDFGAGFGSFYYLKHLPFDYVKIDGEFVHQVARGGMDRLVFEAVVGVVRGLGKQTIAEHVADESTLRTLQQLGVDLAQGYHVGAPAPIGKLDAAHGEPTA
jgi:diguanylate cyclase (GGDEF)-like protein/PAS domain S-box-containing protein